MNVIPLPQKTSWKSGGYFRLGRQPAFSCPPEDKVQFSLLAHRLRQHCGISISFFPTDINPQLRVVRKPEGRLTPGWYRILIQPEEVTIQSRDAEGVRYALVTLFHLLRERTMLPCGQLEDWPAYPYRGQHLDTARHYFPMAEVKRIVEQLSLLKYNVLHWNFANDQAWRLESRAYPKLTEGTLHYTWREVRELVAFAQARGVTILPEFEIPGHSSAAVSAYPHLCCREKSIRPPLPGGIYPYILCAGKQSTYDFIDAVLQELMELFPSAWFHLGGDEAPKSEWKKCPRCRDKLHGLGLRHYQDLQAHMANYAHSILKAHGRQGICWNDGLLSEHLDDSIWIQFWKEPYGKHNCYTKLAAGRGVILSNLRPFYFDYPHCISSLRDVYAYRPHIGRQALDGRFRVLGLEGALWTEQISSARRLEHMLFPRAAALAETAWSGPQDYGDFRRRLALYSEFFAACGIAAARLTEADPGRIRKCAARTLFAGAFAGKYAAMGWSMWKMRNTEKIN